MSIEALSYTQLRLSLSGNAIAHGSSNTIVDMNVSFLDAAFQRGDADSVLYSSKDFKVRFKDPYRYNYYDINNLVCNSSFPWTTFDLQGVNISSGYGVWYDGGDLRFETYTKPMVCESSSLNISVLSFGTDIGPGSNWVNGGDWPNEHNIRTDLYTDWDGQVAYMGFRFESGAGDTLYGWFQISVNATGDAYTLLDYAYYTGAGQSIRAGEKVYGEYLKPMTNANGPYTAFIDSLVSFSSYGSFDGDGTISSYLWHFGDGDFKCAGKSDAYLCFRRYF